MNILISSLGVFADYLYKTLKICDWKQPNFETFEPLTQIWPVFNQLRLQVTKLLLEVNTSNVSYSTTSLRVIGNWQEFRSRGRGYSRFRTECCIVSGRATVGSSIIAQTDARLPDTSRD